MLAIRTILHPTDFSKHSQYAFGLACALARDYGARLVVLHVVTAPTVIYGEGVVPPDMDELRAEAQEQLDGIPLPHAGIRAERGLEEGDAVETTLRVAQEVRADLIAMGTHGRTGILRLLMGSVAEQVLRKATCPVLTVRTPFPETVPEAQPAVAAAASA